MIEPGMIIAAVAAAGAVLAVMLWSRRRMSHDLRDLSADMGLAENVARIGYWSRPAGSRLTKWSSGMFEIFEQDPAAFIPSGDTIGPLFLPEDLPAVAKLTDPRNTDGKGGEVEARIRCPDGKIKHVVVAARYRFSRAGKFLSLFGIVADITARKAAERAVAEREEQLQRAVSAMGAAIWDWDIPSDRMFAGSRFAEILGIDPLHFAPTMTLHHQLCHPQDLPRVQEAFRNHVKTGAPYDAEYRMRHADGHYVWVHSRGRVVTFSDNQPVRAIGTVVDITERRTAQDELQRNRESLEFAIQAAQAGHFDVDMTGQNGRAYWSPRAREILGVTDPNFNPTAASLPQHIVPEDLPEVLAELEEFMTRDVPIDIEVRVRHAAGHLVWVHVRVVSQKDASGKPVRSIGFMRDVSQRREAARALAESERKFRDLIEGSLQGLVIMHIDRAIFCNTAYAKMLGYDRPEDVMALPTLIAHVPPERRGQAAANWELALSGRLDGKVARHAMLDRLGRRKWFDTVERLIQWEGRPARQISVVDATEQELAGRELADSERRYRLLIESDVVGVVVHRRFKPLFCNPAYARMLGYDSTAEVLELDSIALRDKGAASENLDEWWERFLSRELDGFTNERRVTRRDGTPLWIQTVNNLIEWDGQPAVQVVVLDINSRKEVEAQLRASEERFRLLAENSTDVIVLTDENRIVRYISPAIERLTGMKPEDVIGRESFELVYPDDRPTGKNREALLRNPTLGSTIWRMGRADGSFLWAEANSALVDGAPGSKRRVISSIRNVTDRVEREAELAAARDSLKHQADDLTELAQSLDRERARAEQANAAKSSFLAMMSHELRTPMTGVLGMADLLMLSKLTEEQNDLVKLLKRSAKVLLDLLNDILDFSKIEAGQLETEAIPFRLSEVMGDVVNLFSSAAAEKGVALESRAPATYQDAVKGDPKRLRQVLSNLVGNAVKFTERGRIVVSLSQENGPGGAVISRFDVTDTGIGMVEDDIARLFQPFVQVDISTSRKYGGTGLGLAISKRLVEAMGGAIGAVSAPGKGSTFTFSIQTLPDAGTSLHAPALTTPAVAGTIAAASRRILLAEDNETSRYLITAMLARLGHVVDAVGDGAQAVAAVEGKAYDIVLMDMQMPVMDGPDAARAIRKMPDKGRIPIIALTADVIADHRNSYLEAGVNVIVGKPIDWAELTAEIDRHMSSPQKPPGGNSRPAPKAPAKKNANGGPAAARSAPAGAEILDEAALRTLADALGKDVLANMLVTFAANMHKYRDDLQTAVADADLKQAKRTAHALKGLCAQFGALRASGIAKRVEMDAASLDDVRPLLAELTGVIADTDQALSRRVS